jgi:hypothetical protein
MEGTYKLSEVPGRFLHQSLWQQILEFAPATASNETVALSLLNAPHPDARGMFGDFWSTGFPGVKKDHIAVHKAGASLLSQCRELLVKGELTAFAYQGQLGVQPIPNEIWANDMRKSG